MLGYLAAAAAYGFAKSAALGARSIGEFGFGHNTASVLEEELVYRLGIERGLGRTALGLSPMVARVGSAALFGLDHTHPFDATLGGLFYSYAFDRGGLPLAAGCHLIHNLMVYVGGAA